MRKARNTIELCPRLQGIRDLDTNYLAIFSHLPEVDGGVLNVYILSEYKHFLILFYYCQLILKLNVAIY